MNANPPDLQKAVVVLMSGGVDSSVAAALLAREGLRVVGMTMKVVPDELSENNECCSVDDAHDARRVAQQMGFPHYVVNVVDEFRRQVIERFIAEYRRGRTPNPCMLCNEHLKFAAMWKRAAALGAAAIATGHYARVVRDAGGPARLQTAADAAKDQSYFLWGIPRDHLPHVRFPLGELVKTETRSLARAWGLPIAEKRESQDICFVADDYRDLVSEARSRVAEGPGHFVDVDGNILGPHEGIEHYTVGQRRGLGIGGLAEPLYVTRIDAATGNVIVGRQQALLAAGLTASGVNFVSIEPPVGEFACRVKIRSRHRPAEGVAWVDEGGLLHVRFRDPQRSVAPGQGVVLYDGATLLGGAVIDEAVPAEAGS